MQLIQINVPVFRHSDFKIIAKKAFIKKTKDYYINCSTNLKKTNKEFKTKKYSLVNFDESKFYSKSKNKKLTRSEILSSIILKNFKDKNIQILDYGCNKGYLLKQLKKKNYKNLSGFDLINYYEKYLKRNNIEYFNQTKRIKKKFDLIIFSHSISYVNDIKNLFKNIKKILKSKSYILINLQNINKRPLNFLYGDQKYHFNKNMVINFFGKIGNLKFINNDILNHEFIIILKLNNNLKKKIRKTRENDEIKRLKMIIKKIKKIEYRCNVFGKNLLSALCVSLLGNKIQNIVTERSKSNFFNKKPISFSKHLKTSIPLLMSSKKILKKFSIKNNLKNSNNFVCI
tara:strand:- start:970 stop:1998 length:1029 start_codon:yes stop_codon:yes gene_type:complete